MLSKVLHSRAGKYNNSICDGDCAMKTHIHKADFSLKVQWIPIGTAAKFIFYGKC